MPKQTFFNLPEEKREKIVHAAHAAEVETTGVEPRTASLISTTVSIVVCTLLFIRQNCSGLIDLLEFLCSRRILVDIGMILLS